jgi:acetylornithine deacetylase
MIEYQEYIELLQLLISIPSYSGNEEQTADSIAVFLQRKGIIVERHIHNVYARNSRFSEDLPTLLLNSHHDTVQPNQGYSRDPFEPCIENDRLYGLGSNDAGGSLIALLATFCQYHDAELPYNLIFAASAEEEISGPNGIESLLPLLGKIDCGIVGEPTGMQIAIAERGLLVLDCTVYGTANHAAYGSKDSALYKAMEDIDFIRNHSFEKSCTYLGKTTMNVTMINAGTQHNIIPDKCTYTIDIRMNAEYSPEEIIEILQAHLQAEIQPRSLRLRPSVIEQSHPLIQATNAMHVPMYASMTMSDQALMRFPTIKFGPGDSHRSHSADEFIYLHEIHQGIDKYIDFLSILQDL